MNKPDKRAQRDYTLAFKLAVVDQVERGEMTYKKGPRARITSADSRSAHQRIGAAA